MDEGDSDRDCDTREALHYFKLAKESVSTGAGGSFSEGDSQVVCDALRNMASAMREMDDLESAMQHILRAMEVAEKMGKWAFYFCSASL